MNDQLGNARRASYSLVLGALGTTLQTCTACHAVWKQRVVDALDPGPAARAE
jgi:hypothetical protein